jgi:hypothetical protein
MDESQQIQILKSLMNDEKFAHYGFDETSTRCAGLLRMISMLILHSKNENVQLDAADILGNDHSYTYGLKNQYVCAGVILPYVHAIRVLQKNSNFQTRLDSSLESQVEFEFSFLSCTRVRVKLESQVQFWVEFEFENR